MPTRRASAAGHNTGNPPTRVHRSNGSNHSVSAQSPLNSSPSLSYSNTSSMPATPQQKVVYVLVNRLKNKVCFLSTSLSHPHSHFRLQSTLWCLPSIAPLSRRDHTDRPRSRASCSTSRRVPCRARKRFLGYNCLGFDGAVG